MRWRGPTVAVLLALVLPLAGCSGRPAPPPAGPGPYLTDDVGDAEPQYDLVEARWFELNGSLALRVQVKDYTKGLPLVEARMTTDDASFYVRLLLDPSKPAPPKVRAETGSFKGDQHRPKGPACWFPSFPTRSGSDEPWWIVLEFLDNVTGLEGGGHVRGLAVTTADTQGNEKDRAERAATLAVQGRPNPYEDCPLGHERSIVTRG